ncbi:alpha/beta hydrolase [Spongiactinospora rosea]|uniref:Alpha/beta hydrolase n=1 Tax=Spongiactinospora rosea TaxID=2248750 RepID=A0A366M7B1_9ACTN|nr:alpha/beta fold hydrolase [Spongiactinospora rosea]RBQ21484.1 alpha/beta hydrolase [Spongiactinospora rosea]
MSTYVTSKDGTRIRYERAGEGPAVILVDGALCHRSFGPMSGIAALLAEHLTVINYDRRGRGESGDTEPYSVEREIEDIEALIGVAGGSATLAGLSSGAVLALDAAGRLPGVERVIAYEAPLTTREGDRTPPEHLARLQELVAAGRRGDAVAYFMTDMAGVPAEAVAGMRGAPVWPALEAVAHTLPYDTAVLGNGRFDAERGAPIKVPALVMSGELGVPPIVAAARHIAETLPDGRHAELAGQSHEVAPEAIAPAIVAFVAS